MTGAGFAAGARVIIKRVARAGEILGLCATLSGGAYEVTAETSGRSQANFVRAADFTRFPATNAEASSRAAEQLYGVRPSDSFLLPSYGVGPNRSAR